MNYYELLNIAHDADGTAVKRAYFSAVKLHSPDSDPEGFKAIRTAYETLSDTKKRAEYDTYFVLSGGGAVAADVQNNLLAARELIRQNRYHEASEFLTGLIGGAAGSEPAAGAPELKRLLAEVFLRMKKSGTADRLCGELLEKNPSDGDTLLLRANIAASQGFKAKAIGYFNDAVNAAPQNARAWTDYMLYALNNKFNERIPGIFQRAMELDQDMFRGEYTLYLVGVHNWDLFTDENYLPYYDKFAEFYINDKNPEEQIFENVMGLMPRFIEKNELIPFVEKILPTLEKSKQRTDEYEKDFLYIHGAVAKYRLKSDKRIHDVLVDLTHFLVTKDNDKKDQQEMEIYIVFHLSELRPSIKVLMNEYPEYFKLNYAFYLAVLNEKKSDFLLDKYIGIHKKINPASTLEYNGDDFDDTQPFVREAPKVGRNDPCPCGSGKKYKKCCGRNL